VIFIFAIIFILTRIPAIALVVVAVLCYNSGRMNTGTQILLYLALVLFAGALTAILLKARRYKTYMEGLAKAVDGRAEVISSLRTRLYLLHGIHSKLKYRCSFTPAKNDPPEFAISLYGSFPAGLSIVRRKKSGRTSKAGGTEEIRTGDADFDKLFVVRVRQGHSARSYLEAQARRALITRLLNREDAGLFSEGASVRVIFKGLELQEVSPNVLSEYLDQMTGLTM
jgi:hypothetical protein